MSESNLLSPSFEGVSFFNKAKRIYLQHLVNSAQIFSIHYARDVKDTADNILFFQGEKLKAGDMFRLINISNEELLSSFFKITETENVDWLLTDIRFIVENDNIFSAIDDGGMLDQLIVPYMDQLTAYPSLLLHLKLMSYALPKTYSRSLYSSLLSILIAKEMRLSVEDSLHLILASLGHDIGMLTVNPSVLEKDERLDAHDWFQIQQHLPTSVYLLRAIPNFPAPAVIAVAEHHERCDGTGYPDAKVESEISLLGQILGLSDSLAAIYYNRCKPEGRHLQDAARIIELNKQAYLYRSFEIIAAIVQRGNLPLNQVIDTDHSREFIQNIHYKNQFLFRWFQLLRDCLLNLGFTHGDRQLHALQNVIIHISTSVRGSGLFDTQTELRLTSDQNDSQEIASKIESLVMMQQELVFHLQRLNRMIQIYLESTDNKNPDVEGALRKGFSSVIDFIKT